MNLDRVAVLGGGPGGLYAARLLKLSHPTADVTVYEQNAPDRTFGFGVGLASKTQRNLYQADAESFEAIVAASHVHDVEMRVGLHSARLPHRDGLAIGRSTLLAVLERQAQDAGVRICAGSRRSVADLSADLIVAADGINSTTRTQMADRFQPRIETGAGLYLWCGTDFELPSAVFTPVTTEHGTFVAHAYPYAPESSTFLIETDEVTWRRAGFDLSTDRTDPGGSDDVSLRYLEAAFADTLQHHRLIGNRTKWMHFRTVVCRRWHSGKLVLIGDAAHTAHYSIGSGTKLAMEDAIELDRSVRNAGNIEEALATYEEARRPAVDHLQEVARVSEHWWESFPSRMHLPVDQLLIAYMTRAGKVSVERFLESAPTLVRQGLTNYAGVSAAAVTESDVDEWILRQPLECHGRSFKSRVASMDMRDADSTSLIEVNIASAWGPDADAMVKAASAESMLWLVGPADRSSVLCRINLAERLVHSTDAIVVVESPVSFASDVAAGLASARAHMAFFSDAALAVAESPANRTVSSA